MLGPAVCHRGCGGYGRQREGTGVFERILRLIHKWLKAGVSEDDQWSSTVVGIPQGATISPLLANVYLHYVLDLWVEV